MRFISALQKIKRLSVSVGLGGVLTMLAIPAGALNGNVFISSCACTTTADFISAAKSHAQAVYQAGLLADPSGTYLVASSSKASSAYISVTGQEVIRKDNHFQITATVPIDALGNSLAALSESAQEAVYSAVDLQIFPVSRTNPTIVISPYNANNPGWVPPFGTDLAQQQLSDGLAIYGTPAQLAAWSFPGAIITIQYPPSANGDVITAKYIVTVPYSAANWMNFKVTFYEATVKHKNGTVDSIDMLGNIIPGPNTAGLGGGSATVPGFGPTGGGSVYNISFADYCYSSTTATWEGVTSFWAGVVPC